MPSIGKLLARFTKREREGIEFVIEKIVSLDWKTLDVKKLKGHGDIFRVRKGAIRIIYRMKKEEVSILNIERRSERTYKHSL